jgi:two-component system NtrC family sensor kinase
MATHPSDKHSPPHPAGATHQLLEHFEQMERQFQAIRQGLQHSHRLATLGTIASVIAHEYNNILTPVISYAQLALKNEDDVALMKKAVEKALQGALRASSISESLLGFAREADEAHACRLRQVIDDALTCQAREPRKDGITLEVDVPDVSLAISPLSLQQVLVNLMLNARKAMGRQGGTIRITGRRSGDDMLIEVSDTGPGIPETILHSLFEPFVTQPVASDDAEPPARGTGLGLCICRDLIRQAGGDISVTSIPGQGATFHIHLPISQDLFQPS